MGSRARRLITAIRPLLPAVVVVAGFVAEGAKRWRW